jgi:ubiquitin thioesterase protein OTUB1
MTAAPGSAIVANSNSTAAYTMASQEELAHLEKLSSEYEPEATVCGISHSDTVFWVKLSDRSGYHDSINPHANARMQGPLVSEKMSTSRITTEYMNGDPVYRNKTQVRTKCPRMGHAKSLNSVQQALPRKYSEYRTCRGDGHCGWRAIAFCYFEVLQRIGNKHKFLEEETRLHSMKNMLNSVGFQEPLYEDFAEETFELLRRTGSSVPLGDNGAALLGAFNDQSVSMAIITHLKVRFYHWYFTK